MAKSISIAKIMEEYPLPDSEYTAELWALALSARERQESLEKEKNFDDAMAINNALYLILQKYIPKIKTSENPKDYLKELLGAVSSAKYEYSQVCHDSDWASDVMQSFKGYLFAEYCGIKDPVDADTQDPHDDGDSAVEPISDLPQSDTPIKGEPESAIQSSNDSSQSSFVRWFSKSWFRKSLTYPLVCYLYYVLPALFFIARKPSLIAPILAVFFIAYFIHVYLLAIEPNDKKDIELGIVAVIYVAALSFFAQM